MLPGVSANLQINYAGTGTLTFTGGTNDFAIVNAPNAAVVLHGGADFYGSIMANKIDDSGGTNLHFDQADSLIGGQLRARPPRLRLVPTTSCPLSHCLTSCLST